MVNGRPRIRARAFTDRQDIGPASSRPNPHNRYFVPAPSASLTLRSPESDADVSKMERDNEWRGELRAISRGLAALRMEVAALRLLRLLRKANFNPNQPRVPRGNPHGGRWTRIGGSAGSQPAARPRPRHGADIPRIVRVSHDNPDRPKIPRGRPATEKERNAIVKQVARWAAANMLRQMPAIKTALWLLEFAHRVNAYLELPKTLEELQRAVGTWQPDTHIHHIVEKTPAEQDGFGPELIDAPENKVRISRLKHEDITAWFARKNRDFGMLSPREYLRRKSWADRRKIGLDALIEHGVLKP